MVPSGVHVTHWRRVLAALAGAALLGLIAACGGGDDPTATPTTSGRVAPTPTATAPQLAAWEVDWNETLKRANEEEGLLLIASLREPYRAAAEKFSEFYPDLRVEARVERSPYERILREQQAGIFSLDVISTASRTAWETLRPAGGLGDTRAQIIVPELLDEATWVGTFDDQWMDNVTKKHVLTMQNYLQPGSSWFDTDVINSEEFTLEDLLSPPLQGNWCLQDPRVRGGGSSFAAVTLVTHGSDFLLRLFTVGEPVIHADVAFLSDEMEREGYPVCFGASDVDVYHQQGVALNLQQLPLNLPPVDAEFAGRVKSTCCGTGVGKTTLDGFYSTGAGGPSLLASPPNANAAKIFLNWSLSRDGQFAYQEFRGFRNCAARVDLHTAEFCPPGSMLEENGAYLDTALETVSFTRDIAADIGREAFGGR